MVVKHTVKQGVEQDIVADIQGVGRRDINRRFQ